MKPHILLLLAIGFSFGCSEKDEQKSSQASDPSGMEQRRMDRMSRDGNAGEPRRVPFENSYAEENWPAEDEGDNPWLQEFSSAKTPEEKIEVLGRKQATGPEQLASLIRASLKVSNENLRIEAVQSIPTLLEMPEEVPDLVTGAVNDPSSEVRTYAMDAVNELSKDTRLKVYESTIAAPDYDVRKTTITELSRIHSKQSFEVLMKGLETEDAGFREEVNFEIGALVNKTFGSYSQAKAWWDTEGSPNYDDTMIYTGDDE
jgi:hypothetical protein